MNIEKIKNKILDTYNSEDLTTRTFEIGKQKIVYFFLESVASDDKISDFINKSITNDFKNFKHIKEKQLLSYLENTIPSSKMKILKNFNEVFNYLPNGFTCLFIDGYNEYLVFETKSTLDRGVSENTSEPTIRGPKDSFTENHIINVGLIRKRIKDEHLNYDTVIMGRRTKTKVSIFYINDIVDNDKIKKIKNKLNSINIDAITSSTSIREILIDKQNTTFPKMISTERPDLACSSLLNGKIVILVENTPTCIIIPGTFFDFLKSPDDNYQKPLNASITRIIRFVAFIITITVPAFYIAIMGFNHEAIPEKLLISLATQREGVPFPTVFELLVLTTIFEILRECDIRTPSTMGTSISIVGALVLGQAAVDASLVSQMVVIIVAVTDICSLLLIDIDFINATRLWRIIFIIFSSFLGLIGLTIALIIFIINLTSLESIETPYLAPLSPFYLNDQKDTILRFKTNYIKKRPKYLNPKNKNKIGGNI